MLRSIFFSSRITPTRIISTNITRSYVQLVNEKLNIPPPTQDVPNVETFLTKIGRNAVEHAENFESWEHLFTLSSADLKEKGIDTRLRRYILAWREKFRKGEELREFKRGVKKHGGERKRRLVMSQLKNQENMKLRALRKKWLAEHPEDAI